MDIKTSILFLQVWCQQPLKLIFCLNIRFSVRDERVSSPPLSSLSKLNKCTHTGNICFEMQEVWVCSHTISQMKNESFSSCSSFTVCFQSFSSSSHVHPAGSFTTPKGRDLLQRSVLSSCSSSSFHFPLAFFSLCPCFMFVSPFSHPAFSGWFSVASSYAYPR